MKAKKSVIVIVSAVLLVAIGLVVTLVVINTKKNRTPQTSEKNSVIVLDIPGAGQDQAEVTDTSEEVVAPKADTDKKDTAKDTKDTKTTAAKENKTTTDNQTKQQTEPEVIIEPKQEETKISNPQSGKGNNNQVNPSKPLNQSEDGIIELPFVPYEDLKEN